MENINDYIGTEFVGQERLRRTINFLIDGYKKSPFLDNILLIAQRGDGKTLLCRKIGEALGKKFIEINGSSLNSIDAFVNRIIIPHVSDNQDVTLFIDEFATVSPKVLEWLLSMLQYDAKTKTSHAVHDGITHNFDFNHLTFLAATTNPEKLSNALKSRFRQLEFFPYKHDELVKMLCTYTPHINYVDNIHNEIISVSRGSPRSISLRLAEDIKKYINIKNTNKHIFSAEDWMELKHIISIQPLGLTPNEIKLLQILQESPCTVTCLTGKFNMDMATLRKTIELYPLSLGLITINQKREITHRGREIIKTCPALT